MKILVFSDTHLTNVFDAARFEAMTKMIAEVDQVIINGDFWDGYIIKFNEFVESGWNQLFPLLKQKNAVYVHGNHDRAELTDERVSLFSVLETHEHRLRVGEYEYIFTHGHLISPSFDGGKRFKIDKWQFGNRRLIAKLGAMITLFMENLSTRLFGVAVFHVGGTHNIKFKRWAKHRLEPHQRIVCGHSHTAEVNNRRGFYNSGAWNYGAISCLLISEEGVELHRRKY